MVEIPNEIVESLDDGNFSLAGERFISLLAKGLKSFEGVLLSTISRLSDGNADDALALLFSIPIYIRSDECKLSKQDILLVLDILNDNLASPGQELLISEVSEGNITLVNLAMELVGISLSAIKLSILFSLEHKKRSGKFKQLSKNRAGKMKSSQKSQISLVADTCDDLVTFKGRIGNFAERMVDESVNSEGVEKFFDMLSLSLRSNEEEVIEELWILLFPPKHDLIFMEDVKLQKGQLALREKFIMEAAARLLPGFPYDSWSHFQAQKREKAPCTLSTELSVLRFFLKIKQKSVALSVQLCYYYAFLQRLEELNMNLGALLSVYKYNEEVAEKILHLYSDTLGSDSLERMAGIYIAVAVRNGPVNIYSLPINIKNALIDELLERAQEMLEARQELRAPTVILDSLLKAADEQNDEMWRPLALRGLCFSLAGNHKMATQDLLRGYEKNSEGLIDTVRRSPLSADLVNSLIVFYNSQLPRSLDKETSIKILRLVLNVDPVNELAHGYLLDLSSPGSSSAAGREEAMSSDFKMYNVQSPSVRKRPKKRVMEIKSDATGPIHALDLEEERENTYVVTTGEIVKDMEDEAHDNSVHPVTIQSDDSQHSQQPVQQPAEVESPVDEHTTKMIFHEAESHQAESKEVDDVMNRKNKEFSSENQEIVEANDQSGHAVGSLVEISPSPSLSLPPDSSIQTDVLLKEDHIRDEMSSTPPECASPGPIVIKNISGKGEDNDPNLPEDCLEQLEVIDLEETSDVVIDNAVSQIEKDDRDLIETSTHEEEVWRQEDAREEDIDTDDGIESDPVCGDTEILPTSTIEQEDVVTVPPKDFLVEDSALISLEVVDVEEIYLGMLEEDQEASLDYLKAKGIEKVEDVERFTTCSLRLADEILVHEIPVSNDLRHLKRAQEFLLLVATEMNPSTFSFVKDAIERLARLYLLGNQFEDYYTCLDLFKRLEPDDPSEYLKLRINQCIKDDVVDFAGASLVRLKRTSNRAYEEAMDDIRASDSLSRMRETLVKTCADYFSVSDYEIAGDSFDIFLEIHREFSRNAERDPVGDVDESPLEKRLVMTFYDSRDRLSCYPGFEKDNEKGREVACKIVDFLVAEAFSAHSRGNYRTCVILSDTILEMGIITRANIPQLRSDALSHLGSCSIL